MTTQDFTGRLALTRVEASKFLGISPATIDRLTKRGLLRPSRATRRPLYALTELQRFLADSASLHPFSDGKPIGGTRQRKEVK
jgi:hypothetical protein